MVFDCDACCRQRVRADGRRAYCDGAEGADWVADAASQRYVIHAVAVALVVFVVCLLVVVWDLIVTRVAENEFERSEGEHIAMALSGLTGLHTLNLASSLFMPFLLLWLCLLFVCF